MSTVTTTPLPQAATLDATTRILRIPASAAGQTFGWFDAAGKFVPLVYLQAPVTPTPALADTDALPEGSTNLYYTEDRVAEYYHDNVLEFASLSVNPSTFTSATSSIVASNNQRYIYTDSVAVTVNVDLPFANTSGGAGDFGAQVEFSYRGTQGGILTLSFTGGGKVDSSSTLKVYPGDTIRIDRGPATGTAQVKLFKTVAVTNAKYAGPYSFVNGLFAPEIPADPTGLRNGVAFYARNGQAWLCESNGDLLPLGTARYLASTSPLAAAVLAGTFSNGELQGTQPLGSTGGLKFVTTTYGYEYMLGPGGAYVWCRFPKG